MSAVKRKLHSASTPEAKVAKLSLPDSARAWVEEQNGGPVTRPQSGAKSFSDLGVIDSLCEACEELGWKKPTP